MKQKKMSFASVSKSFVYAFNGLAELFIKEHNAKLHTVVAIAVIAEGIVRHISPMQWVAIIFAIGFVLVTEAVNTCIEKLCNIWCDGQRHPEVKIIKDISAAAVLVSAIVSVAIGIIVFIL